MPILHKIPDYLPQGTTFIAGFTVMVFEIAAARAFAPYLGTSLISWTSVIGTLLLALSLGNWAGGYLADRRPTRAALAGLILTSAMFVVLTALYKDSVLRSISNTSFDLRAQAVLAALILLAPVSTILGTLSPYATRLQLHSLETSGRTVGLLSALGSLGSITGTFLAGFVLLPELGTNQTFTLVALILATWGSLTALTPLRTTGVLLTLTLLFSLPVQARWQSTQATQGFHDIDTAYSRIWIRDTAWYDGQPIRVMEIDGVPNSAKYLNSTEVVFDYHRFFRLAENYQPSIENALLIGGAGYNFANDFLTRQPSASLQVVEIDPKVTELARTYFNLQENPRLTITHADGRPFLNRTKNRYDAIYVDAFGSYYSIPFQLTTKEATEALQSRLNPGGIVLVNIIGTLEGPGSSFMRSLIATYQATFTQVDVYPVQNPDDPTAIQNIVLVAQSEVRLPAAQNPEQATYLTHLYTETVVSAPILTDNQAPVEKYVSEMLTSR